jgi:hypothetical protein
MMDENINTEPTLSEALALVDAWQVSTDGERSETLAYWIISLLSQLADNGEPAAKEIYGDFLVLWSNTVYDAYSPGTPQT